MEYIPQAVKEAADDYVAIQTSGKDNKCFYNCLSILFTGSELHATFMNLAVGAAGYVYRDMIIRQVGQ